MCILLNRSADIIATVFCASLVCGLISFDIRVYFKNWHIAQLCTILQESPENLRNTWICLRNLYMLYACNVYFESTPDNIQIFC